MDTNLSKSHENDNEQDLLFWQKESVKGIVKYTIEVDRLISFCSDTLGFYNYVDYTGNYLLVKRSRKSIIKEVKIQDVKQAVKRFLFEELEAAESEGLWTAFATKNIITENFVHLLDKLPDTKFNVSTKDEAFFFFRNGVVKITPDMGSILRYEDFEGTVWEEQIIKRDFEFTKTNETNFNFNVFLKNISNNNNSRYLSLISIMGYLLHPYKDPSVTKAVILIDENVDFSGEANGGTGKTLIAKALEHITPTVWKDGKKFNPQEIFVYDDIRPHHRILYFDDVKKNFSFEEFYSLITGNLKVNRKYKDSTTIPASLTPKLLISTNFMIKGTGGETDERRKLEFEIAPYYSLSFSPKDEFNQLFFDDWSIHEWRQFDNLMMHTVNYFMKFGIIQPPQVNLKENKLKIFTDPEFVEFMDSRIVFLEKHNRASLLDEFKTLSPAHKSLSSHTFTKWIRKWVEGRGYSAKYYKSSGNYIFIVENVNS